jgi:hypothetical protein
MTVQKRAFTRCNGGHYFTGPACPFDGWSSDETRAIAIATEHLALVGASVSIEDLQQNGLTAAAIERVVVIEFSSPAHAFDALLPELVVVENEVYHLNEAPIGLK